VRRLNFTKKLVISFFVLTFFSLGLISALLQILIRQTVHDYVVSNMHLEAKLFTLDIRAQQNDGIDHIALQQDIENTRPFDEGYFILLGEYNEIIAHPFIDITQQPAPMFVRDLMHGAAFETAINEYTDVFLFNDAHLGYAYIMVFDVGFSGFQLIEIVPQRIITRAVNGLMIDFGIIAFIFVFILLIMTMFIIKLLTRNMEERQETEEKQRIIIDNMPMVSNFRDRNFNMLECNEEAVRLFELSSKEEYITRFDELSPVLQPDGQTSEKKSQELISRAFEENRISFEWMHQKLDGTPIPTEVTLLKVQWQGDDNLIAFVRDLRPEYIQKQAEELVRARLNVILNSSPFLVTIFDENNHPVETNDAAERFFEIADKQIYIDNFYDFSPKLQPDNTPSQSKSFILLNQTIDSGISQFEWTHQTSSGELIPCEVTVMNVTISEKRYCIAYTRDLREFYELQDAIHREKVVKDQIRQKETEHENMMFYTNEIEQQYTAVRKIQHDYQNVLMSLNAYIDDGNLEALQAYYHQNIISFMNISTKDSFALEGLGKVKVREIKSILAAKLMWAQSMDIKTIVEAKADITTISVDPIVLVRMLGIILDNAVEEIESIGHGIITVAFHQDDEGQTFIVQNTCRENIEPLFQLKKFGYSTKGRTHGLGLNNLSELASTQDNVTLQTSCAHGMFTQKISIEKIQDAATS